MLYPTDRIGRKKRNVLFSDSLNTYYLRLYGVGRMVKYHSARGNIRLTEIVLLCVLHRQDRTDRIAHSRPWSSLEREIVQWVHHQLSIRRPGWTSRYQGPTLPHGAIPRSPSELHLAPPRSYTSLPHGAILRSPSELYLAHPRSYTSLPLGAIPRSPTELYLAPPRSYTSLPDTTEHT